MGRIKSLLWLQQSINVSCLAGIVVSAYGLYVEIIMEQQPDYQPICDLHQYVSCSKALNSRFGTGLGLIAPVFGEDHWLNQKNALFGFALYVILMVLGQFSSTVFVNVFYFITIGMNLLSIYLTLVLVYLRTLCLVCFLIYVVNFVLLVLAHRRRKLFNIEHSKKRR